MIKDLILYGYKNMHHPKDSLFFLCVLSAFVVPAFGSGLTSRVDWHRNPELQNVILPNEIWERARDEGAFSRGRVFFSAGMRR